VSTKTRTLTILAALALASVGSATAQDTCPCPPPDPPPPLWTGSVGLSYLSTSGNTDTESLGFTANWTRRPTPWGLEIAALANRAETDGVTTAERYYGGLRGLRALNERFELFGGLSYASDEFAGFDSRVIAEAGGVWKALLGPKHELAFDAGLTWTQEEPVLGDDLDFLGAVAGVAYAWKITESATLRERLLYFPNFDTSDDWRMRSETTLEAALAASWAVRVGYLYTRDNLPAPGFEESDSATSVSLVWKR
jgi:putative salt-induced outer membrane protein